MVFKRRFLNHGLFFGLRIFSQTFPAHYNNSCVSKNSTCVESCVPLGHNVKLTLNSLSIFMPQRKEHLSLSENHFWNL